MQGRLVNSENDMYHSQPNLIPGLTAYQMPRYHLQPPFTPVNSHNKHGLNVTISKLLELHVMGRITWLTYIKKLHSTLALMPERDGFD